MGCSSELLTATERAFVQWLGSGRTPIGAETRAEILRVSLELFTEKGYEGTTTRDISTALGITKSSPYYHFQNKEAIAESLVAERGHELDALLAWVLDQPPAPDLLRRAALRWIDGTTPERIQAMLLAQARRATIALTAEE